MLLYMDTLKCSTECHTLDTTAKLELGLGNVGKIIQTKNVRVSVHCRCQDITCLSVRLVSESVPPCTDKNQ